MPVREVLRMGHPFLNQVAEEVNSFASPELDSLLLDMLDTMREKNGAGIAAPQIGVGLRVVVFGIETNPRYPDVEPVPLTMLVNPKITVLDDTEVDGWEGCLSVPGMRGVVPRFKKIRYEGFNAQGEAISTECDDFHARVVQHEVDHLDGILYPCRIRDLQKYGYIEELEAAGLLPKLAVEE